MTNDERREIDALARAKSGRGGCAPAAGLILASWLGVILLLGAAMRWWGRA